MVIAIEADQALHHQLADGTQGGTGLRTGGSQLGEKRLHVGTCRCSGRQLVQLQRIAATDALGKARALGPIGQFIAGHNS